MTMIKEERSKNIFAARLISFFILHIFPPFELLEMSAVCMKYNVRQKKSNENEISTRLTCCGNKLQTYKINFKIKV